VVPTVQSAPGQDAIVPMILGELQREMLYDGLAHVAFGRKPANLFMTPAEFRFVKEVAARRGLEREKYALSSDRYGVGFLVNKANFAHLLEKHGAAIHRLYGTSNAAETMQAFLDNPKPVLQSQSILGTVLGYGAKNSAEWERRNARPRKSSPWRRIGRDKPDVADEEDNKLSTAIHQEARALFIKPGNQTPPVYWPMPPISIGYYDEAESRAVVNEFANASLNMGPAEPEKLAGRFFADVTGDRGCYDAILQEPLKSQLANALTCTVAHPTAAQRFLRVFRACVMDAGP
jgi:hypothetical protein